MNYRLDLDLDVVHFLRSRRKNEADQLILWMERLKEAPFLLGSFTVHDATGREIQVSRVEAFLVFHRTDHLGKTVRVNTIEEIE